ncbi:Mo-dependent nitrogenase family protein (plasmid) [Scytonema sp. HK-05]|uniref:Mo-dependent nitrogenase C-terminal domain-containing protein n=1 Tax=Scytonema sp. HK-05 TaxID=1137095 RepID=UPI000A88BFFE|nr:Mo-dependent nitrogenase family protein [Scytonema sp. HK-05]
MMKLVSLQKLVNQWFDAIEFDDPNTAQLLCKIIPAHCPFEREIKLCNYTFGTHSTPAQAQPCLRASS